MQLYKVDSTLYAYQTTKDVIKFQRDFSFLHETRLNDTSAKSTQQV